jgi:hypothetical protein
LTQPKEKIDWESAINEAHGIQTENQPEAYAEQALEVTAPSPKILYRNQLEGAVNNSTLESHELDQVLGGADEVVELLGTVSTHEEFTEVIQGLSSDLVEDAITLQDSIPVRQQLRAWHQAAAEVAAVGTEAISVVIPEQVQTLSQTWQEAIKVYGEMLLDAVDFGIEAVKDLLKPWTLEERWGAFLQLEELAPERMHRLVAIAPNWFEWCDSSCLDKVGSRGRLA